MSKRIKKNTTGLYFDSFKHFKNNISNLISVEMATLLSSSDLLDYLSLKPVNAKSKLPDMKKIGLLTYNKPSHNIFELTPEGKQIYEILEKSKKEFSYPEDTGATIKTITPNEILSSIDAGDRIIFNKSMLKLLLSYFDTADYIRPYLLLIKLIEANNITKLDNDILYDILAQPKLNILNKKIKKGLYNELDVQIQAELRRPISYIRNFLQTSMIIDMENNIIYDKDLVNEIILELDEINILGLEKSNKDVQRGRSVTLQSQFRNEVLENYRYKCALTGKPIIIKRNSLNDIIILEAAHIIPYSEGGSFSYKNGISLTPELHKLFDLKLFTFEYVSNDKLRVVISKNKNVVDNGLLREIEGKEIDLKSLKKGKPDKEAIEYRSKKVI